MNHPPKPREAQPLASVLIAVHNEQRHIVECLRSLLAQDYSPLEIILADDGSTDDTVERAQSLGGVRVLRLPHRGKALTLNQAAQEARGEILLFLDGDMVFEADYVSQLIRPIHAEGRLGTAHGSELVANSNNAWARCWQTLAGLPPSERLVLSAAAIASGSQVFRAVRKMNFIKVGGFDDIGYADDQTLASKLGANAHWVANAKARHYNPETLGEVWAGGRWSAKTIFHQFGRRALWRYSPPLTLCRALSLAFRHRNGWLVAYVLSRDTACFLAVLRAAIGLETHNGK